MDMNQDIYYHIERIKMKLVLLSSMSQLSKCLLDNLKMIQLYKNLELYYHKLGLLKLSKK
jgi:hypothetical protein